MNARVRHLLGVAVLAAVLPASAFGSGFPVASTGFPEYSADVAFDGTNFLVSIQESHSPLPGITGAKLVSPAGVVLASVWAPTGDAPNISFDGTNYLLVWADHSTGSIVRVHGLRVSTAGVAIGSPFFVSQSTAVNEASGVAFDGTNYLVVWTVGDPNPEVHGRLVSTAGAPVGNDFQISNLADGDNAAVAFLAPNYLVAYNEGNPYANVFARFVSTAGVPQAEFVVNGSAASSDNAIRIATDGTNFLVTWSDEVSADNWDLFGQLVSPSATLVGGVIPISTAPGAQLGPYAAFDGVNFLVTWSDFRNDANSNYGCDPGEGLCTDIGGQFVSAAGALVGASFAVTTDAGAQAQSPTVYGAGRYLVVCTHEYETPSADVFGTFVPVDLIFRDGFESEHLHAVDGGLGGWRRPEPQLGRAPERELRHPRSGQRHELALRRGPEPARRGPLQRAVPVRCPTTSTREWRWATSARASSSPSSRGRPAGWPRSSSGGKGAQFSLMGRARLDDNSLADTGFFNIGTGPHLIEIEWKRATSPVSADGEFRLWIDEHAGVHAHRAAEQRQLGGLSPAWEP